MDPSDKFNIAEHSKKNLLQIFHAYQQAIDESIISAITSLQGIIIHANKKFCEVSKYREDELVGQNHRIVNSGYHSKEFWKNMWQTIEQGGVWHGEVKNKAKDGTFYWVDTVILPIKDSNGKTILYLSLRRLINEKKQAEQEKEEYIKALENMIFMTSHKVRQPVAHFLGLINVLDFNSPSNNELLKIYGHIKTSATALDTFTRELSDFIYQTAVKYRSKI